MQDAQLSGAADPRYAPPAARDACEPASLRRARMPTDRAVPASRHGDGDEVCKLSVLFFDISFVLQIT